MSGPASAPATPITERRQLVEYLSRGARPPGEWRVGTEHEKFAYTLDDLRPLPYEGPRGIEAVLTALQRYGWQPYFENDKLIALTMDGQSVSLEPGGQLELSGAPLETIHQTCDEVNTHLRQVKEIGLELGIGVLGVGFNPKWRREDIPVMPKGRYAIMKAYMPKVGTLGLDMMFRTCTVQANLDFASEADMVRKFRVSLALQPIATALFARSPFTEGKPNGYLSYRSQIWTDTDNHRSGVPAFAFEDGFGFERYVDYLLDVPMYFVHREGRYIDASGQSFRDFLDGRLPALPGAVPTIKDWADHVTTAFPEVRLKSYLEMRGADTGGWAGLCALPALWVGILYDQGALDAAWDLVKDWRHDEVLALRNAVPREGLKARLRDTDVRTLAGQVLDIASAGLAARDRRNSSGDNETLFLRRLRQVVETGKTPAEDLLDRYHNEWGGEIDPIFTECAY